MKYLLTTIYFCLLFAARTSAEDVIVDVDFGGPSYEVTHKKKGIFDGSLPFGVTEDFTGWNSSIIKATKHSEGGKKFIRFNVEKLDREAQLIIAGPLDKNNFKLDGYYKLEIEFRARNSVEMYTRLLPKPYHKVFGSQIHPKAAELWSKYSVPLESNKWTLPASEWEKPVGLFLSLPSGIVDIAKIKLVKLAAKEMSETLKRPDISCKNFFRNSRFPLGIQSGWNLNGEFTSGKIEADISNQGPSGAPSLKIEFPQDSSLISEPFQTSDPNKLNHFSFAYRAEGVWSVYIVKEKDYIHPISIKKLKETAIWTVVSMDFKTDITANRFSVHFAGKGTLYIDSLRAWVGDPEEAYISAGECEVALALPQSEISQTRIQFKDEPAKVIYYVTGNFKNAVLKSKVFTAYGDEKELPGIPLFKPNGEILFDVFSGKNLGQFRIETWIEREGKRISPFNEILVTRIRKPHYWGKDAPINSPFGCHLLASPLMIDTLKAAGINWVRLHDAGTEYIGWNFLEPRKGEWKFRDDDLKRYRRGYLRIFGTLETCPQWAAKDKSGEGGWFNKYCQPENLQEWCNYVFTVCKRYKGIIDGYYIWNEPWSNDFWHTEYDKNSKKFLAGKTPANDYAKLSELTYKTAKAVDPDIQICGFNTGGNRKSWTEQVLAANAMDYCDLVDFHTYMQTEIGYPGDRLEEDFRLGLSPILNNVTQKPIHMSEGKGSDGSGTADSGLYSHTLLWKAPKPGATVSLANAECCFVLRLLTLGCKRVNLYSAHCYYSLGCGGPRCLVGSDGYPLPSIAAFSNLAWHLEDKNYLKAVQVGECWAWIFEGEANTVAVISSSNRNGKFQIPLDPQLDVCDLFGNPSDGIYKGSLLYVRSNLDATHLVNILTNKK